jgi:ABC-type sugar transport system substrate-binding protein
VEDNAAQGAAGMAIAVTDAVASPGHQAAIDAGVKVVWIDSAA